MKNIYKQVTVISQYSFWPLFIVILYLSFANTKTIERINSEEFYFRLDYIFHFLAYMGLVILYKIGKPNKKIINFFLSPGIIATLLMAIFTEAAQYYIPWRAFNWWDMVMNVGGFGFGVIVSTFLAVSIQYSTVSSQQCTVSSKHSVPGAGKGEISRKQV